MIEYLLLPFAVISHYTYNCTMKVIEKCSGVIVIFVYCMNLHKINLKRDRMGWYGLDRTGSG
jgi:hypothetical protein